jgi:hypothetical protein
MASDNFGDIKLIEDEEFQDIPQTGINGFERPISYTTSEDPKEILNLNAGSLRVDDSANIVGNLLSGSRSISKNGTGIAAYSFGSEKSVVSDSLGGIAGYTNVGSFTTSVYDPVQPEHIGFGTYGTFGNALATNGNGSFVIIGNKNSIIDGYFVGIGTTVKIATYYGSAYLYERISNNFIKRGCIVGQYSKTGTGATHGVGIASTSNDDYGHSVAMSLDGKTFAVGGPKIIGESTKVGVATTAKVGVVWVYEYNAPTKPEFCGVGTLPTCCGIGTSTFCEVLESGLLEEPNSQVCGIGTTSICRSDNIKKLSKLQGEKDGDLFGYSLAISADAKSLIIGAPGAACTNISHQGGITYVYERNDNSYEKVGILTGPSAGKFGSCVSVSAEGNIVAVGDSIGGKSYIFEKDDTKYGSFVKMGTLTNGGTQVCVSNDGATIITANASSSTVYDRSGSTFTSVGTLSGGSVGISCSPDGKIITTASSTGYNVYNREGNVFYLNTSGGPANLDSFDMSASTKVIYSGSSTEVVSTAITGKVYCYDQNLETFVYTSVDGNIGIGITNPTSKLHVAGNTIVTGIATVGLGATSTPPSNSQMSFELTSNTNLRIKVRGTDGVLRSADITLA